MNGFISIADSPGGIPRPMSIQGDVTVSAAGFSRLSRSGVRPGTYNSVKVDSRGRVTEGFVDTTIGAPVVLVSSCPDPDVSVVRSGNRIHTINIPDASASSRGLMTPEDFRLAVSRDGVLVCRGPGTVLRGDLKVSEDGTASLPETGVKPGTYYSVTVDAKGRVVSGSQSRSIGGINGSPGALESVRVSGEVEARSVVAAMVRTGAVVSENDIRLTAGNAVVLDSGSFSVKSQRFALGGSFVDGRNTVHGPLNLGEREITVDRGRVEVSGKFVHNGTSFPDRYTDGALRVVNGQVVSVPDPEPEEVEPEPEEEPKVKWIFPDVVMGREGSLVKVEDLSVPGEVRLGLANPRFNGKFTDFVDVIPPALVLADDPDEIVTASSGESRRGSLAVTGEGMVRVSASAGTVLAAPL